jgi:uncharacterized membrane protein
METLYKVVCTGNLIPGTDREQFISQFSKRFRLSEDRVVHMLAKGKPFSIKKNATKKRAQEYQLALQQMGMETHIEPMGGEESAPTSPPKPPAVEPDHNPYAAPSANLVEHEEKGDWHEPRNVPPGHAMGWLKSGFGYFRGNPGAWIGVVILWFLISIVLSFIPLIGQLAFVVISPVITAGFMLGCRDQDEGEPFRVAHLFAGFSNNRNQLMLVGLLYLAASIVIGIVLFVVVGGAIFGAMMGGMADPETMSDPSGMMGSLGIAMLLIMGLTIPLMMAYWFAPALVSIEGMNAIPAMKYSFQACMKNIVPFLIYGLVLMVLMFIAIIPIGLGLLVLIPVMLGSIYASYRDLFYD